MFGPVAELDLYKTLGMERGASVEVIRKAYKQLARKFHPDVNPNNPKAEERFKEIAFAYEVLSDEKKRTHYDEFGTQGLAEGFDPEHARAYRRWSAGAHRSPFQEGFAGQVDLEDLISQLFGRGFSPGAARTGPAPGRDSEGEITVDFLTAVRGDEVRVSILGKVGLRVRVPAGADEGTRIRLAGQGGPGRDGGSPGDLYLTLHVRPHRFFKREGADLHLELPVTLSELIDGASVNVPTPEGPVKMTIPPGSRSRSRLRLRGKGVAQRGRGPAGDLLVRLVLELPETDDPRLEPIARELDALYQGADLRKHFEEPE